MTSRSLQRAAALFTLSLLLLSCSDKQAGARNNDDDAELTALTKLIRGAVVYHRPDGIYKTVIGEKGPVLLAEGGSYPRWSPDGKYVAFLRGKTVLRVAADGSGEEALAKAREPVAVGYHPNGKEILFIDGRTIRAVDLETRKVRKVVEGYAFRELDISEDGTQLVATVSRLGYSVIAFDLRKGKDWRIARGCSASLSPDGRLVTNNGNNHGEMYLRAWSNGKRVRTLKAPPGRLFDNQKWSNRQDWLVSKTEGEKEDVFVHQISRESSFQVTFTGDCDRPDLYISEDLGAEKGL